jgi:hypothetical protein
MRTRCAMLGCGLAGAARTLVSRNNPKPRLDWADRAAVAALVRLPPKRAAATPVGHPGHDPALAPTPGSRHGEPQLGLQTDSGRATQVHQDRQPEPNWEQKGRRVNTCGRADLVLVFTVDRTPSKKDGVVKCECRSHRQPEVVWTSSICYSASVLKQAIRIVVHRPQSLMSVDANQVLVTFAVTWYCREPGAAASI